MLQNGKCKLCIDCIDCNKYIDKNSGIINLYSDFLTKNDINNIKKNYYILYLHKYFIKNQLYKFVYYSNQLYRYTEQDLLNICDNDYIDFISINMFIIKTECFCPERNLYLYIGQNDYNKLYHYYFFDNINLYNMYINNNIGYDFLQEKEQLQLVMQADQLLNSL